MNHYCTTLSLVLAAHTLPGATIFWGVDADGNWENAANWSPATVPTAADNVIIDESSDPTVTINSNAQGNQITADDNIVVSSNNSLTAFDSSTFNGNFTLSDRATFTTSGGTANFFGATNFDGGNLSVLNGGLLSAPNVSSYTGYTGFVANKLEAVGVESTLDLSSIATMTGNTAASVRTQINAINGGYIDLSNLMTVSSGRVSFKADGTSSTIDLTSFESLNHTGNITSQLIAQNGGSINLPFSGVDLVTTNLQVDATSFIDFAAIENYNGGTATIDGQGAAFTGLVNADGTGFVALNGAVINLSTLTDYNGSTNAVVTTIEADGLGSSIFMDQVQTLTGNTFASARTQVSAINGGLVDLNTLETVDGGATDFFADGANSLIDLSSVTSITNNNNINGIIEAINGGEIRFAQTGVTVSGVDLLYDGTGILDHSAFSQWRDGSINVQDTNETFSTLIDIDGSSLLVADAAIAFPAISSYKAFTGFKHTNIAASDGSIDLSGVTSLTGNTAPSTSLNISAVSTGTGDINGHIDLSNLTTINPSTVSIAADGDGATVNLSSLNSMEHSGNIPSIVSATNNGLIDLGNSNTSFTNVSLYLDSGGTIFSSGVLTMNGGTFGGNGTLNAGLNLNSGILSPGNSAGLLSTTGDLTVGSGTVYAWELASLVDNGDGAPGMDWDAVSGQNIVFLSGSQIMLGFDDVNGPDSGDAFWNLAHTWTIAHATNAFTDSGLSIINDDFARGDFFLTSSTDQLFLNFTPVPEPQTYALFALGGGLVAFWFWRRRKR